MRDLLHDVAETANRLGGHPGWELEGATLTSAGAAVAAATDHLLAAQPSDALAGASPYLAMVGCLVGGWAMARSALVCLGTADLGLAEDFRRAKLTTARFYLGETLPEAAALLPAVTAGARILFEIDP
jgi:hypothetical protein